MASELRYDGKVVIITGAGQGLGRAHALAFGARGAKVVVNDLGGGAHGDGKSAKAADEVVEKIKEAGGEAVASYDSVEDGGKIVQAALDSFGRLDVVVNNAGILRDTSFHKMTQEDWDLIYRVHVLGTFRVTHAAWPHMRDQSYGRIVMTSSAAGIYGNFGQANYAMAKLGIVGLGNTLAAEGRKKNIFVNTIAPLAGSRLTETVLPKDITDALQPGLVSPLVLWLCHEECEENGGLFEVGGGYFGKLRWERAVGQMYRTGRNVTPEDVRRSWSVITGFDNAEHPASIQEAMQPMMANLQAGPSKGGNEFIDVDAALGYEFPEMKTRYDERDLALYALGVGAAHDPYDAKDLALVYEMHSDGFKALPTFGVVPAVNAIMTLIKDGKQAPGMSYGLDRVLHGEQYTEVKRPLPPKATLTHRARIKDIFDKGKGALIVNETKSYDENGELLIVNETSIFVRGAGGWGGDRGPSSDVNTPPDRAPDAVATEAIPANQALLYRLSGDWNPLHVDPGFATAFGFDKPILHGLCTFGIAGRHVIKEFSKGDPRFFKSLKVRFVDPVIPGETLVTEMWKESDTRIVFRCKVKERDKVVLSNSAVELYAEIPKPVEKKAPATAAKAPAAEPISADIFTAIGGYLQKNAELAARVGKVFQFKLSNPGSVWTVDVKNGSGSVSSGEAGKADCALELTDADFMAMCTGKADAMKLYMGGQLKISGDVMASQKLEFLRKLDPQLVIDAMAARGGGGGGGADAAATQSGEPTSADAFLGMQVYVERHPELAEKVGKIYFFKLTAPESAWTLDLKNGKGSVTPAAPAKPDCTLELSDKDFMDMTSGRADAMKLYMGGQLKISGDVMASQKLEFLKKIDPEEIKDEVLARRAAGAGVATAASAGPARAPAAPTIFEKLGARLEQNGSLASEVGATVQFHVTSPDGAWVVDLTQKPGRVTAGTTESAAAVLTISDDDLEALVKGEESAQVLHQRGKLRVDGDIRVAQRLGFMKGLA